MSESVVRRVLPFLAAAGIVAVSACNVVKAPWEPGAPSPADTTRSGTATADTAAGVASPADSIQGRRTMTSEAAEAMRAAAGRGDTVGGDRAVGPAGADRAAADRAAAESVDPAPRTVEGLRRAGPTYVRYDDGPELLRTDQLAEMLETRLLPVIEEQDLSLRTSTLFWVLVTEEGTVADVVVHTTSTVEAFDAAAAEVARSLAYEPARRGGRPVPVWVLIRVHLLMP